MRHHQTVDTLKHENQRLKEELSSLKKELQAFEQLKFLWDKSEQCLSSLVMFHNEMLETAAIWIDMLDADGNVTFWNHAAERISGYTKDMVIGHKDIWEWLYPDPSYRQHIFKKVLEIINLGDRVENFETTIRCRDGKNRIISWYSNNLKDESGNVVGSIALGADNTERKHAEDGLKVASRRKDEFLAQLAHELRNPLTPVLFALQIMRRSEENPEMLRQAQEVIERQIWHMVKLIDDLLDVSRITRGKIKLQKAKVDLVSIVNSVVEDMRPYIVSEGHQFIVDVPKQPILISADTARLSQILGNLLNNAVKFSNKGGFIQISVETTAEQVLIHVKDNGIGLGPDHLPYVFDSFIQLNIPGQHIKSGLGIGLPLAKKLVEMHEGNIEAHSQGLGLGSEFIVKLPRYLDRTDQAVPMQSTEQDPSAASCSSSKYRLMVVDDNVDTAKTLGELLLLMGHDVKLCHDGIEALEIANAYKPQAVFLDICMPQMDGYEVAKNLRQQYSSDELMLVAMTGFGREEDRLQCLSAGFDHHLVKPTGFHEIETLLQRVP